MLDLAHRGRCATYCWLTFVALITFTTVSTRAAAEPHAFKIAAGSAADTLREFGRQAKVQTLFNYAVVKDLRTQSVVGSFEPEDALTQMLAGTGLTFERIGERTFAVRAVSQSNAPAEKTPPSEKTSERASEKTTQLEEIVVTGSHIRGVQNTASPVLHFGRADIEASGRASTEEFIQGLPQNFSGGSTVTTASAIRGGEGYTNNFGQGTGANLRGLGNDSTLVLLNGRRLAPVGAGNFVDLSLIPLSAIERIDVLTDGASAVYGSDAVGGVVNLITRKEFDGAQTVARYGSVTNGSYDEKRIGQLFGTHWSSGSALLSYDYQDSSALSSTDRYPNSSAANSSHPVELLPPERRRGALLSLSQDAGESAHLYADALYSKRDTRSEFVNLSDQIWDSHVDQYGGTLGATVNLGGTWQADIAAGSSRSETQMDFTFGSTAPTSRTSSLQVNSLDAKADGTLFYMPGGAARLAVGGHYRDESYNSRAFTVATTKLSRNVRAVFGELLLPFVGTDNSHFAAERLELTLAGRYEHYSDFGSTSDPKLGLLWTPVTGLNLRGTYGTSFRAPIFSELDINGTGGYVPAAFLLLDPVAGNPTHKSPVVVIQGNNANLQPEKAQTWTTGFDVSLPEFAGFNAAITYFNIDFKDRITVPVPTASLFTLPFLSSPIYASVVTRTPDLAAVQALYANPHFVNQAGGASPAAIVAIVDERLTNLARRKEQGIDFSLSWAWNALGGGFNAQLAGTYLLQYEDKVTSNATFTEFLNTVSFPVDFKMRNRFGWHRGGWNATVLLNYINSYRDVRPTSSGSVASWNTVDLTLQYDTGARWGKGVFSNMAISLTALNVFDKSAPLALSLTPNGINFDPANANPLGRFVALEARKTW